MPSFRSAGEQARHLVKKKTEHGRSRRKHRNLQADFIASVGTEVKYRGNIKRVILSLQEKKLCAADLTPDIARELLEQKSERYSQSTLDGYRQAMQMVFQIQIPLVLSKKTKELRPRAYLGVQIELLCSRATEHLKFAICLARNGGMRAHELDTICRAEETREDVRHWLTARFAGREDGVRYVVIGKGGLCRQIILDQVLAEQLELARLPAPILKRQREINYTKHYGILGGQSFSMQFSRLCVRVLGWSEGAHGLRHTFAQERLLALQVLGYDFGDALLILSQELGHFSIKNTLTYLR